MRFPDAMAAVVEAYYRAWFRFHPEAAVDAGVPGYEHLLTPFRSDDMGALVCLNDELLVSLDETDPRSLDTDVAIDYRLLCAAARLENEYLLDVEPRATDPARLLPINAIYQLTIRPVADFTGAVAARLGAIPQHLRRAREHVAARVACIPLLWVESAITAAHQGAEFVGGLGRHPKVVASAVKFEPALTEAARALVEFADFLETVIAPRARGELACGRRHFEHLLARRHFLAFDADALRAFGQDLFERTRSELRDACRRLTGTDDVAAALAGLRHTHPPADRLLDVYREQMQAARRFVVERDLVSVPDVERLEVVETPMFLRHQIPFAAYSEPSPIDPEQCGHYYVTPPTDAASLAEHDGAGIMHTCVHEAWPGHHLQFVTANRHPAARTLPRLLNPSATFYEGWALYSEQLMHEEGFLDRPEQRFILLRDRLWRALRIIIDVGLHVHGLTPTDAAALMVEHLGFPHAQALADITWYTRAPTVPSGYAVGWAMINALREQRRTADATFSLRQFHDRLLSVGSVAAALVIERGFGPEFAAAVQTQFSSEARRATA